MERQFFCWELFTPFFCPRGVAPAGLVRSEDSPVSGWVVNCDRPRIGDPAITNVHIFFWKPPLPKRIFVRPKGSFWALKPLSTMSLSPAENRQKCHGKIATSAEMPILRVFIPVLLFSLLQSLPQQELPATTKKYFIGRNSILQPDQPAVTHPFICA